MLQYHFNWKMPSAIAGVTWWNFHFRLFPGAIRSPKLLIVWDGWPGHRSRITWEFIRQQLGRRWVESLPALSLFNERLVAKPRPELCAPDLFIMGPRPSSTHRLWRGGYIRVACESMMVCKAVIDEVRHLGLKTRDIETEHAGSDEFWREFHL